MLRYMRVPFGKSTEHGFSLMEIMIVLSIIAVLSTISMPAMRGFAASRRLKSSAQSIADTFSYARDMAITERTTYLVVFDIGNNRYWLASSETFDAQNPIASAGRVAAATTTQGGQPTVSRTGGVMGIAKPLNDGITITAFSTTNNGVIQNLSTGVDYVYFTPTATSVNTVVYLQNVREHFIAVNVEASTGRNSIQKLSSDEIQSLGLGNNL